MTVVEDFYLAKLEVEFGKVPTVVQRKMAEYGLTVFLGYYRRPGWSGDLAFYLFECPDHGLVYNYRQGHRKRLECPICQHARIHGGPVKTLDKELREILEK